jgi:integrase
MGREVNSLDGDERRSGNYLAFLIHLSRSGQGTSRAVIRLRRPRSQTRNIEPRVVDRLLQAEAEFDPAAREWIGDVRYRLFWNVLFETGMRIGEALSLQHRDWQTSRGGIARVAITPRPHPHGYQLKSGARTIPVTDELDALYGDYVWWLCERGADQVLDDWDASYIFCNTLKAPYFAPMRAESVYDNLEVMKGRVPTLDPAMTPHWFRHTHATAMLLAGVPPHVVSRRLGHANIQTTLGTYGHVTDDAEIQALADWESVTRAWRGSLDGG